MQQAGSAAGPPLARYWRTGRGTVMRMQQPAIRLCCTHMCVHASVRVCVHQCDTEEVVFTFIQLNGARCVCMFLRKQERKNDGKKEEGGKKAFSSRIFPLFLYLTRWPGSCKIDWKAYVWQAIPEYMRKR